MAKMKLKFDKQKIQDFFLHKGEMVALGLTGTVAVLALVGGIWTAMAGVDGFQGTTPAQALQKASKELEAKIQASVPPPADPKEVADAKPPDWVPLREPEKFIAGGWFQMGLLPDSKRRNPIVLPVSTLVDDKTRDVQVNLVEAPYLVYGLDTRAKKVEVLKEAGAAGGGGIARGPGATGPAGDEHLLPRAQAKRLVVVSAAFPFKDQLEVFRKALKKDSVSQLFESKETIPEFLGIRVMRCEILQNGKPTPWAPVYDVAKDGSPVVSEAVQALLTEAMYDEEEPAKLHEFIFPGLVSPLPQLAYGHYPNLELTDMKPAETADTPVGPNPIGGRKVPTPPMGPGGPIALPGQRPNNPGATPPAPAASVQWQDFKKLSPAQQAQLLPRFAGSVYPLDPYGTEPEREDLSTPDTTRPAAPRPPRGGMPGIGAGAAGKDRRAEPPSAARMPDKCLVRFVDTDVHVGKTYQYSIQVRMLNPNYNRPQDVAFKALADKKELESPWAITPPVTVPTDWHYYMVDQIMLDPSLLNPGRATKGTDLRKADKHTAPVQIHHWLDKYRNVNGESQVVGDWVVAERLLFYRGDKVAREDVEVDMAEWNPQKGQFELASSSPSRLAKHPTKSGFRPAAALDFVPRNAPTIVDFVGGRRSDYPAGKATLYDESSLEVLLLSPDGKLSIRNSRTDSDPSTPEGRQRQAHYREWKDRLDEILNGGGAPATGPGPAGGPGPRFPGARP